MAVILPTSIGAVTIKEAYENYEFGIDLDRGPFVAKTYLCPTMASSIPVINALMGIGPRPIRHICPEAPNLRCVNATLVPRGEYDARDGGRPQFNLPLVKATYAVPTWNELPTDDPAATQSFPNEINPGQSYVYMEQSIDFDSEIIKLPNRAYKFFSDGLPVDVPVMRSIAVAQFVLVRRWQLQLPYVNVTSYMNRVNFATFLGQPRGQIMFRKCRTRRTATTDGTRTQEVELVFKWRQYEHNAAHRPESNTFEKIWDGNLYPYQYADLTPLLA